MKKQMLLDTNSSTSLVVKTKENMKMDARRTAIMQRRKTTQESRLGMISKPDEENISCDQENYEKIIR